MSPDRCVQSALGDNEAWTREILVEFGLAVVENQLDNTAYSRLASIAVFPVKLVTAIPSFQEHYFCDSFISSVTWHWYMHLLWFFYLPRTNAGSYQVLSICGTPNTKLHLIKHHLCLWLGAWQSWELQISYTCWRQIHTRLPPLLKGLHLILSCWSNGSVSLGHRSFGFTLCSLLKAL